MQHPHGAVGPVSDDTLLLLRRLVLHPERELTPNARLARAREVLDRPDLSFRDLDELTERDAWTVIDGIDAAFGRRPKGAPRGSSRRSRTHPS